MNQYFKFFISFTLITTMFHNHAAETFGKTTFINRSAGSNKVLQEVNITNFWAPCDIDCLNGFASILVEYNHSFDRDEIGKYLFFNGTNSMRVGTVNYTVPGMQTTALPGIDIFSENLFLNNNAVTTPVPSSFEGSITALPDVQNVVADIDFHFNFDEWVTGLYLDAHLPINWVKADLNLTASDTNAGTVIIANTLGNVIDFPSSVTNITAALNGQTLNTAQFPLLKQPLNFGRVNGAQSLIRVADFEVAIGYNVLCCDYYHLGFEARAIFPTGPRPDAQFWFEPIVGNGHHFEAGAGICGHYELWNNECDSSFNVWVNGKVYHMFRATQRRLFDLKNQDGSQNIGSNRLLLKKFTGAPASPALTEIVFGPNILALECAVKNDIHSEAAILFDYQRCGLTFDTGYKLWVRTQDKIKLSGTLEPNTYGIKGATNTSLTAARTASQTDVRGNSIIDGTGPADNVYISLANISIESAIQPTALTHSIFVHVGYAWDCYDYVPFVGIGGQVEFSGRDNNALDLWSVWAKAGFAFS